ncbi:recombination protein NinG [Pseudomonas tensinigenes]|uniref:Recombination protein NinG n=1 Tax=Pseudomonas tensinigenes TaxID=2745511 RepID=A0ABX8PR57_9PSED|nr:recombination protein NinG [Pseudomonas tensinigenes]QXI03658.1 recombination protein NinG [Pseudomonas tensinigenes]
MTIERKQPRPKKCSVKTCRASFVPKVSFQSWCSPDCAVVIARDKREKKRKSLASIERREIKVRKEKLKSRADHLREAQATFNEWVRLRDADLPCISCGRHHEGQYHAGHYRSVGANPELRFEPLNVWKQCAPCNTYLSGNLVNYRISLLQGIGAEKVEWLEGPHEPRKYTVEEIRTIKAEYRAKARELKKGEAA